METEGTQGRENRKERGWENNGMKKENTLAKGREEEPGPWRMNDKKTREKSSPVSGEVNR